MYYPKVGEEPGKNYGGAISRDCTDSVCPANYDCERTWSYYYDGNWIEDNSMMLTCKEGNLNIR